MKFKGNPLGSLAVAAALFAGSVAQAQEMQFFRIGTGGTAGTYYPIGGLLANSISKMAVLVAFRA